jgi:hypothetical protein
MKEIPRPVVHFYNEINPGKYATVRHYQLQETVNGDPILAQYLNLAENRSFARSNPDYWVKEKQGNSWNKKALTGIWGLGEEGFYFGDSMRRRHLLIFQFQEEQLKVYFFRNYYTRVPLVVIPKIREMNWANL